MATSLVVRRCTPFRCFGSLAFAAAMPSHLPHASAHHATPAAGPGLSATQQTQVKRSAAGVAARIDRTDTRLSQGTQLSVEVSGQYHFAKRLAAGLSVPVLHTRPENAEPKWGIGNLGVDLKAGYAEGTHAGVGILQARLPTQTVQLGADPGAVWGLGLISVNTWTLERLSLLALSGLTSDFRPAGAAIDGLLAGFVGYAIFPELTPSLGFDTRLRVATWCRTPALAVRFCPEGRASDAQGKHLALEAAGVLRLIFEPTRDTLLSASALVPVVPAGTAGGSLELAAALLF